MRVFIHRHQNKADELIHAIQQCGNIVTNELPLDLALIDYDGPPYYRKLVFELSQHEIPVLLYSHGATSYIPLCDYYKAGDDIKGYLAISETERDIMKFYGFAKPIEVIGWYWCEQKPLRPMEGQRVLFAPIHPLGNGFIPDPARDANTRAFLKLVQAQVDLTVYYLGDLQAQGLWSIDGVNYQRSQGVNRVDLFDRYDCVVSYGTFAYLAIASGMPTYMYAQDIPPWDGHNAEDVRYANHYPDYISLLRYPYDLDDCAPLFDFGQAEALQIWKDKHIGKQLNPKGFVKTLEKYAKS